MLCVTLVLPALYPGSCMPKLPLSIDPSAGGEGEPYPGGHQDVAACAVGGRAYEGLGTRDSRAVDEWL